MKTKTIQFIPALLALAAIGFSYFSLWCTDFGHLCYRTWLDSIFLDAINPLHFFSLFFLPVALILAFTPRNIFNSWLKLAAWIIPLSFIVIALTPVNFTGIGMNFFPFYRDDAARLMGEIFSALTLALIIWEFFASRRKFKKQG